MDAYDVQAVIRKAVASGQRTVCVTCPDHDDEHPSLLVTIETGMAHCLAGCRDGRWFPISAFYSEIGIPTKKVLTTSRPRTQGERDLREVLAYLVSTEESLRVAGGHLRYGNEVLGWLHQRGLSPEIVSPWVFDLSARVEKRIRARFGDELLRSAGLLGSNKPIFGKGRQALLVCRDERGRPIGAQIAATTQFARDRAKYLSPGGITPVPFGLDTVPQRNHIVITEGIVDALSVIQDGVWKGDELVIPSDPTKVGVVGICGVAAPIAGALRRVVRLAAPGARFIVATDPDVAGDAAAKRIRSLLLREGVRLVSRWRDGDDLNACLCRRQQRNSFSCAC